MSRPIIEHDKEMMNGKARAGNRIHSRRTAIWILGAASVTLIGLAGGVYPQLLIPLTMLFVGVTSCALFLVVWQSSSIGRDPFCLVIATASLCVGGMALLGSVISYTAPSASGLPALLGARLEGAAAMTDAAALCVAPLFLKRTPPRGMPFLTILGIAVASAAAMVVVPLLSPRLLDASGMYGGGIAWGYAVCALLAAALLLVVVKRGAFETPLFALLTAGLATRLLMNATGLLVRDPSDIVLMASRLLICVSFFLVYQGIVIHGAHGLRHVAGIIPICMNCRKIQVSENEWQQLEDYITTQSHALFSHGICPECAQQVLAEMAQDGTG